MRMSLALHTRHRHMGAYGEVVGKRKGHSQTKEKRSKSIKIRIEKT